MFNVIVADVDESQRPNEAPADYVLRLAETKARAVTAYPDQLVLAADTTVVHGNDILGKPKDNVEAFAMLTRLRGHTHQVYTGVALLRQSDGLLLKELCVTDVSYRPYAAQDGCSSTCRCAGKMSDAVGISLSCFACDPEWNDLKMISS